MYTLQYSNISCSHFALISQVELLQSEVLSLKESLVTRESCNGSGHALERIIQQLKEELVSAQLETEEMVRNYNLVQMLCLCRVYLQRGNYERRLQRVKSSSAKSQAESALSLFELRDENQRLEKENTMLLGM